MGANRGSRKSPSSWSFNFRGIHKHARPAALALMAAILFSPDQSRAYWAPCKAKNRAYAMREPTKHAVLTLVERDGKSRSFHVANVKAKTLREKIVTTVSRKSHLMTDELASYEKVGKESANHGTVNHSANEFAKLGGFAHTNTAECRFSLMKRAVFGTHHSISEAHLLRYLAEWDFKWNTRKMSDGERAATALEGIEGQTSHVSPG